MGKAQEVILSYRRSGRGRNDNDAAKTLGCWKGEGGYHDASRCLKLKGRALITVTVCSRFSRGLWAAGWLAGLAESWKLNQIVGR